jgi:hypothetical protein
MRRAQPCGSRRWQSARTERKVAGMEQQSLYRAAFEAAKGFRREIVQRLGPSHEPAAHAEWNRDRFWLWAIERAIEHVEGRAFWIELGRRNYSRSGQRPELAHAIRQMRELQRQLAADSLPSFRAKEEIVVKIAALANQLLE